MYRAAAGCLLVLGCVQPLLALPALGSREGLLPLSAADGGGRSTRDDLDGASLALLRGLLATAGAETADGLRRAEPGTRVLNPRGITRTFQALSGQDPDLFLTRLWARTREQFRKRGRPAECYWKYCV